MINRGQVYALRVVAIAGPHSGKTAGDQHALLVIIRKDSAEEAQRATIDELTAHSWLSPEILQIKTVDLAANETANLSEAAKDALEHARTGGFGVIVFEEPVPKH